MRSVRRDSDGCTTPHSLDVRGSGTVGGEARRTAIAARAEDRVAKLTYRAACCVCNARLDCWPGMRWAARRMRGLARRIAQVLLCCCHNKCHENNAVRQLDAALRTHGGARGIEFAPAPMRSRCATAAQYSSSNARPGRCRVVWSGLLAWSDESGRRLGTVWCFAGVVTVREARVLLGDDRVRCGAPAGEREQIRWMGQSQSGICATGKLLIGLSFILRAEEELPALPAQRDMPFFPTPRNAGRACPITAKAATSAT